MFLCIQVSENFAQKPKPITFYQNIQPIFQKNCVICHRKGQTAPFELISYNDVMKRADLIKDAIETKYMPPFHADIAFQTYHNQRFLPQSDIDLFNKWLAEGKKEGKIPKKKKNKPNPTQNTYFQEPDLVLSYQKPFAIPDNNKEQFRVFVIPTHTKEAIYVRGIDFIPGAKQQAHHCRIMIDTTNLLRPDDGLEVGASSEFEKLNVKLADQFWHGWVPGNFGVFYPKGFAKILPKNADLVINMHYSPTPKTVIDTPKINIYYAKEKPERIVQTFILGEDWIVNQPFVIEPENVKKFYMRSPLIPEDISLISVLPHMHLLGKNFKAYAITPFGQIINILKIDNWDFNWQTNYQFKNLIKLPKGSVVYAEAEYDNSRQNPRNPNIPPKTIQYGWGTKEEMMNLIFEYVPYKEGDEKLDFYGK